MLNNSKEDFICHSCDNVLLWIWKENQYIELEKPVTTIEIVLHELPRFIFDNLPGEEIE